MIIAGALQPGDPGVFRSLLLPEAANALAAGEPLTALGLIREEDKLAIGAMAGYMTERYTFQIVSLYVAPDFRRQGAGRLMMEELIHVLDEIQAGLRIDFTVTRKEHEDLAPFLEAMGFRDDTDRDENIFLVTLKSLGRVPLFEKARTEGKIQTFEELDDSLLRKADREAMANLAPLPEGGLLGAQVERRFSTAVVRDREVIAYVAFDRSCMGKLTLAAVWSEKAGPMALSCMLEEAFSRIKSVCAPEEEIIMQAVNSSSAALIHTLAPDARALSRTYIRMWKPGITYEEV